MGAESYTRNSFSTIHHRRYSPRFTLACCASLAAHLWIAHELPAGAPRTGVGSPPLTVRLQPAAEARAALLSVDGKTDDARVTSAMPLSSAKARIPQAATPSGDRARGNEGADAGGIAPRADLTYYPARQLDVYPALLAPLSITYPERALAEDRAGRALVMVLIDAGGRVNEVTIVEADPPGYFEDAARKTFEQAAFSAARRNGMPVRSRVLIHVNFDPRTASGEAK